MDTQSPALRAALAAVAASDRKPANDNRSPYERLADSLRWSDFIAWLRKDLDDA